MPLHMHVYTQTHTVKKCNENWDNIFDSLRKKKSNV